jgi:hypothetical protein
LDWPRVNVIMGGMRRCWMAPALVAFVALSTGRGAEALGATPAVTACLDAAEQGQDLRSQGRLREALERFAKCAASTCPTSVRKPCSRWQDEVVALMPSIIVVVRDEKEEDVADAKVAVDDGPAEAVSGRAWTLDPGTHTIVVEAHGQRVEQKVVVSQAEANRVVRVRLAKTGAAETPVAAPSRAESAPPPSKPTSSIAVAPLALAGVAVASATVSLWLGLSARGDANDLADTPCGATHTCSDGQLSGIRTRLVIADVALGVAAVSAAVAVWLWVSDASRRRAVASWRGLPF